MIVKGTKNGKMLCNNPKSNQSHYQK